MNHEAIPPCFLRVAIKKIAMVVIISVITTFAVKAQSTVTFSSNQLSIKQAISEIETQTNMRFGFGEELKMEKIISLNNEMSLEDALSRIVGNDFTYVVQSRYIIITKKPQPAKPPVKVEKEPEKIPEPEFIEPSFKSRIAIKTNLIYLASTTANIGVEYSLSKNTSIGLKLGYSNTSFKPKEDGSASKFVHWAVLPEFRYWINSSFEGLFVGAHGIYSMYDVENLPIINKPANRSKGYVLGIGIDGGYHWTISSNWGIEASLGAGINYFNFDRYESSSPELVKPDTKFRFNVTKATLSIVYLF